MKEFFKPTLGKIILTIILLLFGFFIVTITILEGFFQTSLIYLINNSVRNIIFLFLIWPFFVSDKIVWGLHLQNNPILFLYQGVGLVINILWFYLLSCMIVYLYKKIRNKNYPK